MCLLLALAGSVGAQERVILDQRDSPVQLSNFSAEIGGLRGQPPALVQSVRFENKSGEHIVAVQVGFIAFDVLNGFMEHATATDVNGGRPSPTGQLAAIMDTDDTNAFMSAMVYVRGVRYADGRVWKANLAPVMAAARRIDDQFTAGQLSR